MKRLLLASVLILGVTACDLIARRDVIKLDGISGEIYQLIIGEDTQYAPEYSHSDFARICVGMSRQQVERIIGKPLWLWKPYQENLFHVDKQHFVGYQYSRAGGSDNYRMRQVNFDNGKVAEVIHYFYVD